MLNKRINIMLCIIVLSFSLAGVAQAQEIHWSYEGEAGPAYWGELSPDWALCSVGQGQTPIDIPSSAPTNPADLERHYSPSAVNIFNNGHTIQINYDTGSNLQLDGQTYDLLQYHFHASSEHTVDGSTRPMELHLVHRNAQGGLAVIGVFLEAGDVNPAFAPIFDNLPASEGEPEPVLNVMINAEDLLPAATTYWRYNGSLTTPGCAENVKWLVMNTPVSISADQIAAYTAIHEHNARPVQPMNDRTFIVGQQPETLPVTGSDGPNDLLTISVVVGILLMLAGTAGVSAYRRPLV